MLPARQTRFPEPDDGDYDVESEIAEELPRAQTRLLQIQDLPPLPERHLRLQYILPCHLRRLAGPLLQIFKKSTQFNQVNTPL